MYYNIIRFDIFNFNFISRKGASDKKNGDAVGRRKLTSRGKKGVATKLFKCPNPSCDFVKKTTRAVPPQPFFFNGMGGLLITRIHNGFVNSEKIAPTKDEHRPKFLHGKLNRSTIILDEVATTAEKCHTTF
jgi:hypothetical protein